MGEGGKSRTVQIIPDRSEAVLMAGDFVQNGLFFFSLLEHISTKINRQIFKHTFFLVGQASSDFKLSDPILSIIIFF